MRTALIGVATAVVLAIIVVVRAGGVSALDGDESYAFLETQPGRPGAPVTFSSCRPIRVEFNLDGVEDEQWTRTVLLEAMGEASAASHLHIQYAGDTDRRPRFPTSSDLVALPVLIAFADTGELPQLKGVLGRGGPSWYGNSSTLTYAGGQIALEKSYWNDAKGRLLGRRNARATVMHELGHVLGLAHVDDGGEVMNGSGHAEFDYGPGDRAGLAILGQGPCV